MRVEKKEKKVKERIKILCFVKLCTTEYEISYCIIGGVTGITMTVHSHVL